MDVLILQIIFALSLFVLVFNKSWKFGLSFFLHIGIANITTYWAILALGFGQKVAQTLFLPDWGGLSNLSIDNLSAFFILIINFVVVIGVLYSGDFLKPFHQTKNSILIGMHHFALLWLHIAMLLIVMLDEGFAFLFWWEIMGLSSFILIIFQGEQRNVIQNGINYLIQMHLGFLFLLAGFFGIAFLSSGDMHLSNLQTIFSKNSNIPFFLLFFAGFGLKAGIMPLHSWLPRAYTSAPPHIAGIMSGSLTKIGIYGILRLLSYVQDDFLFIGLFLFFISLVSSLIGIVLAVFQKDPRTLLAYSSIENVGIIGLGLGLGLIGNAIENETLMFLGFTGGILHILNHSLIKPMLFYSIGNVMYATRSLDINNLGGLSQTMPYTSFFCLVGVLAICGIPPFNSFISEYLLYSGAFQVLTHAGFNTSLLALSVILTLAVLAGLSVFGFTKLFGLTFLGKRRAHSFHLPSEVPILMLIPNWLIISAIVAVGLFPVFFTDLAERVLLIFPQFTFTKGNFIQTNKILANIGAVDLTLIFTISILIGIRFWQQKRAKISHEPTWGCGYTGGDFRHQYTASSYADSISVLMVKPVVMYQKTEIDYPDDEIFPQPRHFKTHTQDRIEQQVILKNINKYLSKMTKAGLAQTGRIQDYLVYPVLFIILLAVITLLNLI